jgi:hypothetical protein
MLKQYLVARLFPSRRAGSDSLGFVSLGSRAFGQTVLPDHIVSEHLCLVLNALGIQEQRPAEPRSVQGGTHAGYW